MGLQTLPLWIPLQPDGTTQIQHPAELLRAFSRAESGTRAGVCRPGSAKSTGQVNNGDFAATVVPAAMQLTLAAGAAYVPGRETTLQSAGSYFAYSEASETIAWPAAAGTNRMDSLILRVADPQYGTITGNSRAYWDAVAGSSASARPDSDFLSGGSQYMPGAWLRMYNILVPASATQLTQANVTFVAGYANTLGYTPGFSTLRPAGSFLGERMVELDTGFYYTWNGTKWMRDEYVLDQAADQAWTSNITQADITGLSTTVEANCRYEFTLNLGILAGSPGLNPSIIVPASTRLDFAQYGLAAATGGVFNSWQQNVASTVSVGTYGQGPGNFSQARVQGVLATAGTAGTFKIQAAQGSVSASTSWALRGSTLRVKQVA